MTRRTVLARSTINAPIETVWALVADARNYSSWTNLPVTELEREGSPTPDGVGAIRRFGTSIQASREEVIAFDAPTHLRYKLLSGLPIQNYEADVTLTEVGPDQTRVTWAGGFDANMALGSVMKPILNVILGRFVSDLTRAAETRK